MANQMGAGMSLPESKVIAAPSLHDAASLHDDYGWTSSPCAIHTCPTRPHAYKLHIVRTANGRAPVTAWPTNVERRL
eukprot:COSAG01_NODE_1836_length_9084_cov_5.216472_6_plen_77_part_00